MTSLDESPELDRVVAQAVARAKQGDREALRFLYIRYADNVYGYVASIVRDDYEAEDVTQHVFAKLMTALAEVRAARGPVLGVDPPRRPQRRRRPHAPAPRRSPARRSASSSRASTTTTTPAALARRCARRSRRCPRISARSSSCATSSASRPARSPTARPHRAVDPRPAPPRPRRSARRAHRDASARRRSALKAGGVMSRLDTLEPTARIPRHAPRPGGSRAARGAARGRRAASPAQGAFTMGAELEAFEDEFAAYCETDHAVGVSSGTEAIVARAARARASAPATRSSSRRTRSSRPPRP